MIMRDVIQANLKPDTVERIATIAKRPVTRGIDRMINECIDKLQEQNGNKGVGKCNEMMELIDNAEKTS